MPMQNVLDSVSPQFQKKRMEVPVLRKGPLDRIVQGPVGFLNKPIISFTTEARAKGGQSYGDGLCHPVLRHLRHHILDQGRRMLHAPVNLKTLRKSLVESVLEGLGEIFRDAVQRRTPDGLIALLQVPAFFLGGLGFTIVLKNVSQVVRYGLIVQRGRTAVSHDQNAHRTGFHGLLFYLERLCPTASILSTARRAGSAT